MLRLIKLAALAVVLFAAVPAMAQTTANNVNPGHLSVTGCPGMISPCFVPNGPVQVVAGGQYGLTVVSSTSLTVPTGATVAIITVEGQSVRYRDDGTAPTASTGMLLAAGTTLIYTGTLASLEFIQTTATATIDVAYYR